MLEFLDRRTTDAEEYIVCDTKAYGANLQKAFGVAEEKEVILYLQANSHIYFLRETVKRKELREKYVVLYFGSILPLQAIEVILKCIRLLAGNKDISMPE